MSNDQQRPLSALSLLELFAAEAETQSRILTEGLLALDRNAHDLAAIEPLMRAAHSIKGAAAITQLEPVVRLAHEMESCFVAAQRGQLQLTPEGVDCLLAGVDMIVQISRLNTDDAPRWFTQHEAQLNATTTRIADTANHSSPLVPDASRAPLAPIDIDEPLNNAANARAQQALKVSVENFSDLLSLASESLVAANMLRPISQSMQRFKKLQESLFSTLDDLQQAISQGGADERIRDKSAYAWQKVSPLKQLLVEQLSELESCERRLLAGSYTMLEKVVALRMRPFRDVLHPFPRMVRDLARRLEKEIRLELSGEDTQIDREIMASLESPLSHLLRNAVDHGIETPLQRLAAGKPREGVIRIDAKHHAGTLRIHISDDGQGIDLEQIRSAIVARNMTSADMAAALGPAELLEFLFLPAFSMKATASDLSGRGVGLDVVHEAVRQHYGTVKIESEAGKGFHTHITLPVSQSVVRALIVTIAGEAYAVPITQLVRILETARTSIHLLEDKPFITLDDEHLALVSAAQVLALPAPTREDAELSLVVIGTGARRYALSVDAVVGEKLLVVQPIDTIFGKLRDISAAALLDNGAPILILDVADLLQSIENLLGEGKLRQLPGAGQGSAQQRKRVLVVDDSLTVREMERKLLQSNGFTVDVAVDGIDGWNAVRSESYDLVITDVDMPRMDGIELTMLIKKDERLQHLPVMIVSYKDRPEDRARGISAGADYYLTKGSFHDQTLLEAVADLIGEGHA
jgi:two-component system, chemotaxis family, sensor histidine kinase and response regulator WspE